MARMKWLGIAALLAISALGNPVKLYLKDGNYQIVNEYQVVSGDDGMPDRVRYLSAERSGDWEVIPLELVDLDRTKKEIEENQAKTALETRLDREEDEAIRHEKRLAASVPEDTGVYYLRGEMMQPLDQADVVVVSDKTRTLLRTLTEIGVIIFTTQHTPAPILSRKNTMEVDGVTAKFRIEGGERPEFFFRLANQDGFALVRLAPKRNSRVVETVSIAPVTDELSATRDAVATFTKQYSEFLYKIWPEENLPPGEYALVEFEDAQGHLQVWDFGVDEAR